MLRGLLDVIMLLFVAGEGSCQSAPVESKHELSSIRRVSVSTKWIRPCLRPLTVKLSRLTRQTVRQPDRRAVDLTRHAHPSLSRVVPCSSNEPKCSCSWRGSLRAGCGAQQQQLWCLSWLESITSACRLEFTLHCASRSSGVCIL